MSRDEKSGSIDFCDGHVNWRYELQRWGIVLAYQSDDHDAGRDDPNHTHRADHAHHADNGIHRVGLEWLRVVADGGHATSVPESR